MINYGTWHTNLENSNPGEYDYNHTEYPLIGGN